MPPPLISTHYNAFIKNAAHHIPQGAVGYAPSLWVKQHGLEDVPKQTPLPTNPLNRQDVKKLCLGPLTPVLFGYVCAMAWGEQGTLSHEHVRAAWKNRTDISKLLTTLRGGGLSRLTAYDIFKNAKISGLGPSFFTKLMYFFSPDSTFYIMDQHTANSVNLLTGLTIVRLQPSPTRQNKGGNYQAFCEVVDHLASLHKVAGDVIEERLYSGRGGVWRRYVKQHYPYAKDSLCAAFPLISKRDL